MQLNVTPGFKDDTNSSSSDESVKENTVESKTENSENSDGLDEELSLETLREQFAPVFACDTDKAKE